MSAQSIEETPLGAGQDSALSGPATPIALPSPQSQEMVLVRRSEIRSLKRSAKRAFTDASANTAGWAFAWLGIGITALFSLAASLGVSDQTVSPIVIAGEAVFCAVGLFLAAYLFWFERGTFSSHEAAKADFIDELDEFDRRAPTTVPEGPRAVTFDTL